MGFPLSMFGTAAASGAASEPVEKDWSSWDGAVDENPWIDGPACSAARQNVASAVFSKTASMVVTVTNTDSEVQFNIVDIGSSGNVSTWGTTQSVLLPNTTGAISRISLFQVENAAWIMTLAPGGDDFPRAYIVRWTGSEFSVGLELIISSIAATKQCYFNLCAMGEDGGVPLWVYFWRDTGGSKVQLLTYTGDTLSLVDSPVLVNGAVLTNSIGHIEQYDDTHAMTMTQSATASVRIYMIERTGTVLANIANNTLPDVGQTSGDSGSSQYFPDIDRFATCYSYVNSGGRGVVGVGGVEWNGSTFVVYGTITSSQASNSSGYYGARAWKLSGSTSQQFATIYSNSANTTVDKRVYTLGPSTVSLVNGPISFDGSVTNAGPRTGGVQMSVAGDGRESLSWIANNTGHTAIMDSIDLIPNTYIQNRVYNSGTGYLYADAASLVSGASNQFTFSAWVQSAVPNIGCWFSIGVGDTSADERMWVSYSGAGGNARVEISLGNAAPGDIVNATVNGTTTPTGSKHHILIARTASQFKIYIDGEQRVWSAIPTTATQPFDLVNTLAVNNGTDASTPIIYNGSMGDVWYSAGNYIDIDISANKALFIDGNLNPVYLGAAGEIPLGFSPDVFCGSAMLAAEWNNGDNLGTSGQFVRNGAEYGDIPRPPYVQNQVDNNLDGILSSSTLSMAQTSNSWSASFWIRQTDTSQALAWFSLGTGASSGNNRTKIQYSAAGPDHNVFTQMGSTSSNSIGSLTSTLQIETGVWTNILVSRFSSNFKLYANDVVLETNALSSSLTQDFSTFLFGYICQAAGFGPMAGGYADIWFDAATYLDFDIESNRRLFIDENGDPVYLGTNGELVIGTIPDIFIGDTMIAADWNNGENRGQAGNYTQSGSFFTDIRTPSPSEPHSFPELRVTSGGNRYDTTRTVDDSQSSRFRVSMWIKTTDVTQTNRRLVEFLDSTEYVGMHLGLINLRMGTSLRINSSLSIPGDDSWHWVEWTKYSDTEWTIQVDDVVEDMGAIGFGTPALAKICNTGNAAPIGSVVQDVQISENLNINALANWWKIDSGDPQGSVMLDSGPAGEDGTLTNIGLWES